MIAEPEVVEENSRTDIVPAQQRGLKRGNPGPWEGAGRPTKEWQMRVDALVKHWITSGAAQRVVGNEDHPAHSAIVKLLVEQAKGKAIQRTEHSSDPNAPIVLEVIYRGPA